MNRHLVGTNTLKKLIEMARLAQPHGMMEEAAVEAATASLDNPVELPVSYEGRDFESPMNQGHGKTVDDYEAVGTDDAHLFRVTDGEQVAYVRTCNAEKAKRDSRLSGKLRAFEVPAHSDPARSDD